MGEVARTPILGTGPLVQPLVSPPSVPSPTVKHITKGWDFLSPSHAEECWPEKPEVSNPDQTGLTPGPLGDGWQGVPAKLAGARGTLHQSLGLSVSAETPCGARCSQSCGQIPPFPLPEGVTS